MIDNPAINFATYRSALTHVHETLPNEANVIAAFVASVENDYGTLAETVDSIVEQGERLETSMRMGIIAQEEELMDVKRALTNAENEAKRLRATLVRIRNMTATESPIPGYEIEKRPLETVVADVRNVAIAEVGK